MLRYIYIKLVALNQKFKGFCNFFNYQGYQGNQGGFTLYENFNIFAMGVKSNKKLDTLDSKYTKNAKITFLLLFYITKPKHLYISRF